MPAILGDVEKRPFDGIVVPVVGQRFDGSPMALNNVHASEKWERAWFQPEIDRLRACKFQRLTDNFVLVNANPGNVDWFDDAGWENIVDHWRTAAWVARQSGFKGILFDPEPYAQPHLQFGYSAQPQRDKHSFADYHAAARSWRPSRPNTRRLRSSRSS